MSDEEMAKEIAYGWYQFYINAGVQTDTDKFRKGELLNWIARTLAAVRAEERAAQDREIDALKKDYAALKYSYDTLIDCAARYRDERNSARALLQEVMGALPTFDHTRDLRARIAKEIGQ
jgi:hypothetical protein